MEEQSRDRAVSAVVGVVLLLAVTIASVGVITAAAGVAMDDTRTNIRETAAENALYQYDAVVSEVAYGSADQRRVGLGDTGDGKYEIRPDAGEMRVIHRNFSDDDRDQLILEETLGAFVYESGNTEIASQGGAVFRRDGAGSVLLSAPQMRYADQTFTAPVVGLRNGGDRASATHQVRALVSSVAPTEVRYPNRAYSYNNSNKSYANPVTSGAIVVEVESDYYTAWASHFRTIDSSVNVTVDADAERATLVLPTEAVNGDDIPLGDGQNLRGIDENEHAVNELNITLPTEQSDWNSFGGATVEISGFRGTYTVTFDDPSGKGPCDNDVSVDVTAEYTPDTGSTRTWTRNDAFNDSTGAFTYGCVDGNDELYANLTGDTNLTYGAGPDPIMLDQHTADGNQSYAHGDEASIDFLTNHYVAMTGGNTKLELDSWSGNNGNGNGGGQNSIDTNAATGDIDYDSGAVITYLRVTNTTVNTTLN